MGGEIEAESVIEAGAPTLETSILDGIASLMAPSVHVDAPLETITEERESEVEAVAGDDLAPTFETAVLRAVSGLFETSELPSEEEVAAMWARDEEVVETTQEVVEEEIPVIKTPSVETAVWESVYSLLQWNSLTEDAQPETESVETETVEQTSESSQEEPTVESAVVNMAWSFIPMF